MRNISIALSTLLIFVVQLASNASAQLVTENLTVTVDTVLGGTPELRELLFGSNGIGSFTYDPAELSGANFESINADQGLTLELNIFGQTFTESDDRDFTLPAGSNDFPSLSFLDSQPFNLSFRVFESEFTNNPKDIELPGVIYFEFNSLLASNPSGGFDSTLAVIAIPEPSAWLALLLTAGLANCRRCRKN